MCKAIRFWVFVAIAFVLLVNSLALAEGKGNKPFSWMPPGLSKVEQAKWKDGRPPGWSSGEKEGWKKELEDAKKKIRGKAKKLKEFSQSDVDSAILSVEAAARKGVPIKHALSFVEKAMEKGIKGRGIETATRAMVYGVGRQIDFEQLGKFVRKKLDDGLRGDDLAIEIYKEVTRRQSSVN